MAFQIPSEMICRGKHNALLQTNDRDFLCHHIDHDISRNPVFHVVEPFDQIPVLQRRYAHRAALIIDLRIIICDLELGYHIHQLAHFSIAQLFRAFQIQHRDLVKINFLDLLCKITGLHVEHALVP